MKNNLFAMVPVAVILPYIAVPAFFIFSFNSITYNRGAEKLIHKASLAGNKGLVQILLNLGEDVDVLSQQGDTPMACAIEAGDLQMVEFLLLEGADPDYYAPYAEQAGFVWNTNSDKRETGYTYMDGVVESLHEHSQYGDALFDMEDFVRMAQLLLDEYSGRRIESMDTFSRSIRAITFLGFPEPIRVRDFPLQRFIDLIRERGGSIGDYTPLVEGETLFTVMASSITAEEFLLLTENSLKPSPDDLSLMFDHAHSAENNELMMLLRPLLPDY